jgi:hypothetical protein
MAAILRFSLEAAVASPSMAEFFNAIGDLRTFSVAPRAVCLSATAPN